MQLNEALLCVVFLAIKHISARFSVIVLINRVFSTILIHTNMKTIKHNMKKGAVVLVSAAMLNSCFYYVNTAGQIFDQASYEAAAFTSDLRPGSVLYCNGGKYYVELPRYRWDVPVRGIIDMQDRDNADNEKKLTRKAGTEMIQVPEDYAMYLIGQSGSPTTPSFLRRSTADAEALKRNSTAYKIVRYPESGVCCFQYNSPSSFGWYCLGALDWVCVDMPVSIVSNLLLGFLAWGAASDPQTASQFMLTQ